MKAGHLRASAAHPAVGRGVDPAAGTAEAACSVRLEPGKPGPRPVFGLRGVFLVLSLAVGQAGMAQAPGPGVPVDPAEFRQVLEAHRGQVVLVNFWATWCRPCLKEIPVLADLARRYQDRGFRVVAMSLDEPGDLQGVVRPFLRRWFPDLETYTRLSPDMDGTVSVLDAAWNELLPTSYVLDRSGVVRARLQGGKPAEDFAAVIEPLLARVEGQPESR